MNEIDPNVNPATPPVFSKKRTDRPVFVTVICILLVMGSVAALATNHGESKHHLGSWYPAYNSSVVILQAICAVGMWLMKRWAFLSFVSLVALNLAVHFAFAQVNLLAGGLFIGICYFLVRAMPSVPETPTISPSD